MWTNSFARLREYMNIKWLTITLASFLFYSSKFLCHQIFILFSFRKEQCAHIFNSLGINVKINNLAYVRVP